MSSDPGARLRRENPVTGFRWSLIVIIALAVIVAIAEFWLSNRTRTEDEWVRHTLTVRNEIAQVLTLAQRAQSGERGFLLTDQDTFLGLFNGAVSALPVELDNLAGLTSDNPAQQRSVDALRPLASDLLQQLGGGIAQRKAGQADAARISVETDENHETMNKIREVVAAMDAEENRLLVVRQKSAASFNFLLQTGSVIALILICVIGGLVGYLTRRSFQELVAAHDRLSTANHELIDQVSRREQVEGQLRQSMKMEAIGKLTGGIAHDFNNMLAVIGGALALIRRRIKRGDFNLESFIDDADKAVEHAANLTGRLLAFARQQPLAPEPIDANHMIANMSGLLRSTLGENMRIETVSAGGLWTTSADIHQLENAILNLAINARDAMPDGGDLTIETANAYLDEAYCREHQEIEPGQYVMIAVSDTGMGMSPAVAARAFDPFFTTKPIGQGTGLGLSQVYGFIKQSGGHIKIYSEIGSGTTIKIYLPRLLGDRRSQAPLALQTPTKGKSNEVVLVVEDDPLTRRLSVESLIELGYTVLESETARGALDILDGRPDISLLFTDVIMPDMNGKKLADEATRRRPNLKVLFTTGYSQNAVVHGGVLGPGVSLLSKPFALEQLATKLRAVLDR